MGRSDVQIIPDGPGKNCVGGSENFGVISKLICKSIVKFFKYLICESPTE